VIRSRALETFSYRTLLIDYMKLGVRWYSATKPMLLHSLFEGVDREKPPPRNSEPAFDAAKILRFGQEQAEQVQADAGDDEGPNATGREEGSYIDGGQDVQGRQQAWRMKQRHK
jgi:hypothetical protein